MKILRVVRQSADGGAEGMKISSRFLRMSPSLTSFLHGYKKV